MERILTIAAKNDEKFLRKRPSDFSWSAFTKAEIRALLQTMRRTMHDAQGIGLSANQIGLDLNLFVAQVDDKFYAVFNPKIEKTSAETVELEEGCLSVPMRYGVVARPDKITISGHDARGKKIKIKAWGLLARVFQHETDHLNGALFIDKAKKVFEITPEKDGNKKK